MILRARWPGMARSAKNGRVWRTRGGRRKLCRSDEAQADFDSIRALVALAWNRHIERGATSVFPGRDVGVRVRVDKRRKVSDIEVYDMGPRRLSAGQRRDLHGGLELIMDAIEKVAFDDDSQVARVEMEYVEALDGQ